jgi:hypothetical protein
MFFAHGLIVKAGSAKQKNDPTIIFCKCEKQWQARSTTASDVVVLSSGGEWAGARLDHGQTTVFISSRPFTTCVE